VERAAPKPEWAIGEVCARLPERSAPRVPVYFAATTGIVAIRVRESQVPPVHRPKRRRTEGNDVIRFRSPRMRFGQIKV
jgi:hypothetical protein